MVSEKLDTKRRELDALDRTLVETLHRRLATVAEIVEIKSEGLPFLRDHDREAELLGRIETWARELGIDTFRTQEIFREIIAMALKAQEEALLKREMASRSSAIAHRISFQGVEGSYSHIAARKYFADRADDMLYDGYPSFTQALEAAEDGRAGYAFLPIENTTAGSINETYDLLRRTPLRIVGEEILHVNHCLLTLPGADLGGLRRVLSHPQALTQCSKFLAALPDVELVAFRDTAAAARAVADAGDPSQAAIASDTAGALTNLVVLEREIANQRENWTRFVAVSAIDMPLDPRIPAKISLVFTTRHRQGALFDCLGILARNGLNLCKLESRPVPHRPWEYLFYVDLEGSVANDLAAIAIAEMRRECPYLKILGSYPARTTPSGRVDGLEEAKPSSPATV